MENHIIEYEYISSTGFLYTFEFCLQETQSCYLYSADFGSIKLLAGIVVLYNGILFLFTTLSLVWWQSDQ